MILKTLDNTSIEELLVVFNLSFSDYIVPFCLTKEQLEDKINSDSIKLEFSVGAFEDNELIAFVLHGYDVINNVKTVYNAGTGVIPLKRGNKLTIKMYEYILPILQKNDIKKVLLEVITTNETAIKTYYKIGFKILRELNCFKGSIHPANFKNDYEVRELKEYQWPKFQSFWDIKPSWQNSITAVKKLKKSCISIGIFENENLLGYAIFNPETKRLYQLSVDRKNRKTGLGRQLLEYISINYGKEISVTNIENTSKETLGFMTTIRLENFINQYEMALDLG